MTMKPKLFNGEEGTYETEERESSRKYEKEATVTEDEECKS